MKANAKYTGTTPAGKVIELDDELRDILLKRFNPENFKFVVNTFVSENPCICETMRKRTGVGSDATCKVCPLTNCNRLAEDIMGKSYYLSESKANVGTDMSGVVRMFNWLNAMTPVKSALKVGDAIRFNSGFKCVFLDTDCTDNVMDGGGVRTNSLWLNAHSPKILKLLINNYVLVSLKGSVLETVLTKTSEFIVIS